jgi:hypothetical protein
MVTLIIEVCATLLVYLYLALNLLRPGKRIEAFFLRHRHLRRGSPGVAGGSGGGSGGAWGWAAFFRCCCTCTSLLTCCLFGGLGAVMGDFVDVSAAMEELFDDAGHLDVTISDILAGLVLLSREQSDKRSEMTLSIVRQQRALPSKAAATGEPPAPDASEGGSVAPASGECPVPACDASAAPAKGEGGVPPPDSPVAEGSSNGENQTPKRKMFHHLRMLRDGGENSVYFERVEREILDVAIDEDRSALVEGGTFLLLFSCANPRCSRSFRFSSNSFVALLAK